MEKYDSARQATDINITRRMRFACRITKATNTHSEYVTLIAFPRQQWLHERSSVLRYAYITCFVTSSEGHKTCFRKKLHLQEPKKVDNSK